MTGWQSCYGSGQIWSILYFWNQIQWQNLQKDSSKTSFSSSHHCLSLNSYLHPLCFLKCLVQWQNIFQIIYKNDKHHHQKLWNSSPSSSPSPTHCLSPTSSSDLMCEIWSIMGTIEVQGPPAAYRNLRSASWGVTIDSCIKEIFKVAIIMFLFLSQKHQPLWNIFFVTIIYCKILKPQEMNGF